MEVLWMKNMKKWKKILLKSLLAITLTGTSIYLFAPWEFALYYLKPLPDTVQEQVQDARLQNLDGIIVYVQQKNDPPELYAAGWHDRQAQIPAYPNALFKIASIAKLYDASAVTKLAASGKLSLDDSLAKHLPTLADRIEYAEQITLRMLVQHRSGIPNFTDQEGFDWGNSALDVLELALDKPADFPPGTDYAYSNTNYLLLQNIMSEVLGYDYTTYIKENILKPLNLTQTFFSIYEIDSADLMSGYHVGYENDFKTLDQGYVATAEDVGIFLRALNEGSFFNAQESEIYRSLYEYEHTGWVLGYSSIARYHADIDTVVIQFTNTTGNDTVILTQIVYNRIIKILRGSEP
jgi:CubicO group peptidase (beta-lactamase class C family)